jgi:hypothetical protein
LIVFIDTNNNARRRPNRGEASTTSSFIYHLFTDDVTVLDVHDDGAGFSRSHTGAQESGRSARASDRLSDDERPACDVYTLAMTA